MMDYSITRVSPWTGPKTSSTKELLHGQVEVLDDGPVGEAWTNVLSFCSFLGATKNTFFNGFVLEKGYYVKSFYFFW